MAHGPYSAVLSMAMPSSGPLPAIPQPSLKHRQENNLQNCFLGHLACFSPTALVFKVRNQERRSFRPGKDLVLWVLSLLRGDLMTEAKRRPNLVLNKHSLMVRGGCRLPLEGTMLAAHKLKPGLGQVTLRALVPRPAQPNPAQPSPFLQSQHVNSEPFLC